MFSNLMNSRKGSGDRTHHFGSHNRQSSSGTSITPDKIRHPQHVYTQDGAMSPTYSDHSGSTYMARQDSASSSSSAAWHGQANTSATRSPAQLPEEMRAKEKQRQIERERERRERQSSHSSMTSHTGSVPPQDQPAKYSSNHMESSVTRLLVATKMLLESLTKWSMGQRTEEDVSDIYVRLGNDFNSAKLAFGSYGIDMSDLSSVPDDLRDCLERCLSEDASPAVLEIHLPRIREIIINLLQGLKMKQAEYKQFLVQQRAAKEARRESAILDPATQPTRSRVQGPRLSRQGFSEGAAPEPSQSLRRENEQDAKPSTTMPTSSVRPESLQRASSAAATMTSDRPAAVEPPPPGSPALSSKGSITRPPSRVVRALSEKGPNRSSQTSSAAHDKTDPSNPTAQPSMDEDDALLEESESAQATPRLPELQRHSLVDTGPEPVSKQDEEETEEMSDAVGRTEDKLNGLMGPRFAASRSPRHASRPSVDSNDASESDPSLRALKNRDALERRASKRFSAYTFNKMGVGQSFGQGLGMNIFPPASAGVGSPLADRKMAERRGSGARRAARPPLPDSSPSSATTSPAAIARSIDYFSSTGTGRIVRSRSAATDNRIDSIEEVKTPTSSTSHTEDRTPSPDQASKPASASEVNASTRGGDGLLSPGHPHRAISQAISSTDSLPFVDAQPPPSDIGHTQEPQARVRTTSPTETRRRAQLSAQSLPIESGILNVFLQLGRQTRKAAIELDDSNPMTRGISIAKLRMLFIDRFAYSPGMEDFPTIYVKDPASGVTYELEDLNDVQEGSLLTLNIEPLDQVKQHLDLSLGNITRELRELKAALAEKERDTRRMSHSFVNNENMLVLNQTPTKISDSQFQAAGQRVAQLKRANTRATTHNAEEVIVAGPRISLDASPSVMTASGFASGSRIAHELKVQFDELQNLRREFAITRQLQGDFETDVKSILSTVREQTTKVREIASTKVATERNFIVAGKSKLDSSSQDLLTSIEDLQDTVDDLKMDVIQRGVKPKPAVVKQIVEDIEKATTGLLDLEQYVQTVKPSWKKTWETELQNIVDEQEFLNHEEGLISDLRDDLSALKEVFSNIQQVVKLRGGSGKGGKYIPPLPEQGHEGLSTVMMEVKTQAVNHEKRLRALQAAERQRQKDLQSSKGQDEFTEELAGFVDKKVLRKTGGILEAERIRQKRDHATWKAMFGGGGPGGVPMLPQASSDMKPKKLILGKKDGASAATAPTLPVSPPKGGATNQASPSSEGHATSS